MVKFLVKSIHRFLCNCMEYESTYLNRIQTMIKIYELYFNTQYLFYFSAKRRIARCVKRYKQLADQNNTQGI